MSEEQTTDNWERVFGQNERKAGGGMNDMLERIKPNAEHHARSEAE